MAISNKIVFCVPLYKDVPPVCFKSFMKMVSLAKDKGYGIILHDGLYLPFNRNVMASKAIEEAGAEYIFWIDSDQVFTNKDIMSLINTMETLDIDILGALYKSRTYKDQICAWNYDTSNEGYKLLPLTIKNNTDHVIKCDMIGMGFCIMKASVIDNAMKKYGAAFQTPFEGKTFVGDDQFFFVNCKKDGIKTYLDPTTSIGHYGGVI